MLSNKAWLALSLTATLLLGCGLGTLAFFFAREVQGLGTLVAVNAKVVNVSYDVETGTGTARFLFTAPDAYTTSPGAKFAAASINGEYEWTVVKGMGNVEIMYNTCLYDPLPSALIEVICPASKYTEQAYISTQSLFLWWYSAAIFALFCIFLTSLGLTIALILVVRNERNEFVTKYYTHICLNKYCGDRCCRV
jgi:hypothetical protein